MIKRSLSWISLLIIVSILLAACAPTAAPTTEQAVAPTEEMQPTEAPPVTEGAQPTEVPTEPVMERSLTVWHAYAGQADKEEFIKYALDSFQEKYPEIKLDVVGMEHSAYKVKLNTAMASGNPPDVFYTLPGGYLGAFVSGGQVYALDDEMSKDGWGESFMASALDRVRYDGKIYAAPIDIDAVVVWYNKKLFEEKGWQVPTTYDEFLSLAEQIKGEGIVPVALGNKDSWPATFWFQFLMLRLKDTGIVDKFNAGDPSATFMPEAVTAFQMIQDLVKADVFPEGLNGMSDQEANILFLNSKAAMVLNGTWQIGMAGDAPDTFELGFFPFPTLSEGKADQSDVIAGVAACFAVSAAAKDKDAAVLFLKHMTSPEVAAKYVEIRKTLVTVKGAATEENAGPVLYGISKDVLEPATSLDAFYDTAMPPAAMEVYYSTLQGVLDQSITPEDGANKLEQAMKEAE